MDAKRLKDKAQGLLRQNSDRIERGVGKAEKFAKGRTTKHDDKIDKAADKIRGAVRKGSGEPPAS